MRKIYKIEEKLTSEGAELRQPVAELETLETKQKQAEEALQAEKNKLQSVIDAIEYGLSIQDTDYNIIYQSESLRKYFGDHLGEKCYRIYEGKEKVCDGCPVEKSFKDGKSHTSVRKVVMPSGKVIFWENTANLIRDARGEVVSCLEIARNINERKQAEEALRESEEKYKELAGSITDLFFAFDKDLRYTYWNKASEQLTGISAEDALGKHLYDIFPGSEMTKRAERGYLKALRTQQVQSFVSEYHIGGRDYFFEISAYPSKNGLSVFARDITERKQAEEREEELQRELYHSSRLAAIGELAAGIAHQINNPLTGVLGFSQRLLRKSTDPEANQDLKRIYTEAERAAKVVQNLLTFARRRQPQKQYSDINEIIESALELRAYELKTSNIEVVTELATNLPQIMLDFHQIQEVFLNIILNAEQAMTEAHSGGRLTIKTEEKKGYIRTTFNDDGPGIPEEHLDRIFDPFFTTKGERGGTGLGLSVCHGIITEHGGWIYAKSKPGKGAAFFVELSVVANTSQEVAVPEGHGCHQCGLEYSSSTDCH